MIRELILVAITVVICTSSALAETTRKFDVVILNGRVMDPESGHDGIKNVGIDGGNIVALTSAPLLGTRTIDAQGLVVAPGFIDLHHHAQDIEGYQLSVQDGVTTALELENGAFPIDLWYQKREGKAPVNFGATVSHPIIRGVVFGAIEVGTLTGDIDEDFELLEGRMDWASEHSTPAHRTEMSTLLQQGLEQGGLGFGYHLATTPGASREEMLGFYELSAREEVTNFIHIRSFGQVTPTEAGQEIVSAAQTTGASIHVVHVGSSGVWEINELVDVLYTAQQNGLDISTEIYPYTGALSSLDDPRTSKESRKALGMDINVMELVATGERLTEESFGYHKKHAQQRDLVAHIMDEADVDAAVAHPMVMIASDASGAVHPRGAGTFARIFGHYVRDQQTLTLMEALRKVSLMPAQRLEKSVPQMKTRGRIQEGMVADITVFDPARIADQATYASPGTPSVGIAHVLVNGESVISDYQLVEDVYPGRAIRRQ